MPRQRADLRRGFASSAAFCRLAAAGFRRGFSAANRVRRGAIIPALVMPDSRPLPESLVVRFRASPDS